MFELKNLKSEDIEKFNSLNLYSINSNIQVEYSPFNLIKPNLHAKVIFLGLTPGKQQAEEATVLLDKSITNGKNYVDFESEFRNLVPFKGTMRTNLVQMLDEIGLNKKLKIESCEDLFLLKSHLADMTSLLKLPVYKNKKNYSGSPIPIKNDLLTKLIKEYFLKDLEEFKSDILIVPFGKTVSNTLKDLEIDKRFILLDNFPHPSGANGHRLKVFNANKENYKNILQKIKD